MHKWVLFYFQFLFYSTNCFFLFKVLAYEWAQFKINVNAISPTVILTELGKKAWSGKKGEKAKKEIPLGRFGYP